MVAIAHSNLLKAVIEMNGYLEQISCKILFRYMTLKTKELDL
jgi:hypothetical protein